MSDTEHLKLFLQDREAWNNRSFNENIDWDLSGEDLSTEFFAMQQVTDEHKADLRGYNFDRVNLTQVTLSNADLTDASFDDANLTRADLSNSFLHEASFSETLLQRANLQLVKGSKVQFPGAKLEHSCLFNACLPEAEFWEAKLNFANLTEAHLEGATFLGADLRNADLSFTKLRCADLIGAELAGAILAGARPWLAKLYPPECDGTRQHRDEYQNPFLDEDTAINSVNSLLSACTILRNYYSNDIVFYFRGETKEHPELRPYVLRDVPKRSAESEMLNDLMIRQPEAFDGVDSAFSQLVLGQHYGLPTRLLDITRNPLVALYNSSKKYHSETDGYIHVFAVPTHLIKPFNSDTVSVIANVAKLRSKQQNLLLGKDRTDLESADDISNWSDYENIQRRFFHFVKSEKGYFENNIDPRDFYRVHVVEPQRSFERIRAQSGSFLVSAYHRDFTRDQILTTNGDIPVYDYYKLSVLKDRKNDLIRELRLLNVTEETLFPGLDSAATAVTEHHTGDSGS